MREPVVDQPEAITPAWLTGALRQGGHELEVRSVRAERIGTGQMAATYRLHIEHAGPPGPSSLVAKLPGDDPALRALVAPGYIAEMGFYRELAPLLDVRTPRCWYGAIVDDGRFTLLLADAAPATPGVQAEGCSIDQARAALANLVGLHAPLWNDPRLREHEFLMRTDQSGAELMGAALRSATEGFVERYQGRLHGDDAAILRAVADVLTTWMLSHTEPFAVIHGDYRLDNLLFATDGEVTVVDWQTAAVGPPLRDVAYFLGTCLEPGVRREHEEALIDEYHHALVARGVTGYDRDRCWEDYRVGHLQGPMISVLGCMYAPGDRTDRSDEMFLAMTRRSCAAIRELRSLDLV